MREVAVWILVLPDGRIVLQRRTKDAKHSPGLLGLFGGHLEPGEMHEEAAIRELQEETSLDVMQLPKRYLLDIRRIKNGDDALFHIYEARVETAEFEVFEGQRAEIYTVRKALQRNDVSGATKQALISFNKLGKEL
jgi:8-oxo-dGTP pyrophosphatase MutT (NUDIX family)